MSRALSKDILSWMGVDEIQISRLHLLCTGSFIDLVNESEPGFLDLSRVIRILPSARKLSNNERLLLSRKSRYSPLQKRRLGNDGRDNWIWSYRN